jgi:ASC-1-like (ASCH) protein
MQDLLDCQTVHFNNIALGLKKFEGRPNKPKYEILEVGSIINIKNSDDHTQNVSVLVTSLDVYKTFKMMIEDKGLQNVLPEQYEMGVSIDQAVKNVYRTWYSEELEDIYSVLCIGVNPIS